ncbi:MAG TPA: hypothetical protein GXX75_19345 [Clostridiales bacterium]|nr:hypothetical protein [Clostridiales bacterium]
MNSVKITDVVVTRSRITCSCEAQGEWAKYFTGEQFFAEYDEDISSMPKSVAVIPILGTIIPLAFIFDGEVVLDEIDKDFYNAIPKFKQGYIDMYPHMTFGSKITVNKIIENPSQGSKSAIFFSGGVDAFNTLITHLAERPALITVWGADVKTQNADGWMPVKNHIQQTAREFNLDSVVIKTSFRTIIDEDKVGNLIFPKAGDHWWHGFHHGVGIISLAAPLAYVLGISNLYIASSYTIAEKGKNTCASDPTIDNFVRFCGCQTIHDGYEFTRQEKVHRICGFMAKTKHKLPLRVCWRSEKGDNCMKCEKCFRTMVAIIAEKQDPRDYGFNYTVKELNRLVKDIKAYPYNYIDAIVIPGLESVQSKLRESYTETSLSEAGFGMLEWFYKVDLRKLKTTPGIFYRSYRFGLRCLCFVVRRLKGVVK